MKFLSNVSTTHKVFAALVLAVLYALPIFIKSPVMLQIFILIFFYAYLTSSWNFVGGFAGVLPLGHSAFVGLGAYTSTLLYLT